MDLKCPRCDSDLVSSLYAKGTKDCYMPTRDVFQYKCKKCDYVEIGE